MNQPSPGSTTMAPTPWPWIDDDSIDLNTDSILLSETELGESTNRPPSTIIGKAELDLDADLDLSPLDKGSGPASDVKLAAGSGSYCRPATTIWRSTCRARPGISKGSKNSKSISKPSRAASSRRTMWPRRKSAAKAAAKQARRLGSAIWDSRPPTATPGIATSDINLGGDAASGAGLTGLSALELDDDDDQVLGDGSDVTLSGESSGINIISPSDSGLALDEVPLDLSGSAPIGSSLDLGEFCRTTMSSTRSRSVGSAVGLGSKVGEDFQLTPLGEDDADEEKDSSQVIALDELSEETAGVAAGQRVRRAGMMAEDFGVGLTPGAVPVGVAAAAEMPFSIWNVLGLAGCMLLLGLCGMMTFDLLRNMWSWDGVSRINSSLLEVLNPFLGR